MTFARTYEKWITSFSKYVFPFTVSGTTFVHERYKGGFEIAAQMKCTYLCSLILNKKKSYFLN